jgi:hypothetical protein
MKPFDYEAFKAGAGALPTTRIDYVFYFVQELPEGTFIYKWRDTVGVWQVGILDVLDTKHWFMKPTKKTWHLATYTFADRDEDIYVTSPYLNIEDLKKFVNKYIVYKLQYHTFERED